jgi:hypothetical protein
MYLLDLSSVPTSLTSWICRTQLPWRFLVDEADVMLAIHFCSAVTFTAPCRLEVDRQPDAAHPELPFVGTWVRLVKILHNRWHYALNEASDTVCAFRVEPVGGQLSLESSTSRGSPICMVFHNS